MLAAEFNTPEHTIFDHTVCASRATAACRRGSRWRRRPFAAHYKLDNLILIYDSNDVTLDAMANKTQSEDTAKRFEAYGFEVLRRRETGTTWRRSTRRFGSARGEERQAAAHHRTHAHRQGHPRGRGHAEGARRRRGEVRRRSDRKELGLPGRALLRERRGEALTSPAHAKLSPTATHRWNKTYDAWRAANPELAAAARRRETGARSRADLSSKIPEFPADAKIATRKAGEAVLQPWRRRCRRSSAAARTSTARRSTTSPTSARLQPGAPGGAQHPLRHPRARDVRDPERHRVPRRRSGRAGRRSSSSPTTSPGASASRRSRTCR